VLLWRGQAGSGELLLLLPGSHAPRLNRPALSPVPAPRILSAAAGGGGLVAGIAAYVKALKPHIKIIGVEPSGRGAPACTSCLQCGPERSSSPHLPALMQPHPAALFPLPLCFSDFTVTYPATTSGPLLLCRRQCNGTVPGVRRAGEPVQG
jgi:hypothetical protein